MTRDCIGVHLCGSKPQRSQTHHDDSGTSLADLTSRIWNEVPSIWEMSAEKKGQCFTLTSWVFLFWASCPLSVTNWKRHSVSARKQGEMAEMPQWVIAPGGIIDNGFFILDILHSLMGGGVAEVKSRNYAKSFICNVLHIKGLASDLLL